MPRPRVAQPRVIFHVGAHKTGTSLVQKYCRENVGLLRRHRVAYLDRTELIDLVGWGSILRGRPELLTGRLRSMARPLVRDIVASHENTIGRPFHAAAGAALYPEAAPVLEALAGVLRPYRTTVVLSIRPQVEFLESYYLHSIQIGGHRTFADWLDGIDLDAISWRPLVDALDAAFGADHVRIVDFRRIGDGQDAYLRHFFALADPSLRLPVSYEPTRNASISGKGLDLALAANRFLENGSERRAMRVFLQAHFSNLDFPRPALLADGQQAALRARYDAEYDELVSAR